ncbi:MAG: 4-alpha-glucanotransferase [Deltaproteobacteria bacterium]|nr:4-alpha-glucanotransferase [Deltaproteobacteria bacterium]
MALPRCAGVLLPLFSVRTACGWGLGELPDLAALAPWMQRTGLRVLMTLPLLEVALGQASPYSALSAFALDPAHLALGELEDFEELGGETALPRADRDCLDHLRQAAQVDWSEIRRLKGTWLRRSFDRFLASGAGNGSERARDLEAFRDRERSWLFDYALFRALKDAQPEGWWRVDWPEALRRREPAAMAKAREKLARSCAYYEYVQWVAHRQLEAARAQARRFEVLFAGDLPFMVAEDSADAGARQDELRFDASIGAPPDEYSKEGQDWGLPVYRWEVIASRGFDWLRKRGKRMAEAFDLVRVDHVVGFYRTYVRPRDGSKPFFSPRAEAEQLRQGETVIAALRSGGASVVAEDLGVVPAFVRRSLGRLEVPGFRVLRWEKEEDGRFRDPAGWPALSVATTGTHDTTTLATWWEELTPSERKQVCAVPALRGLVEASSFSPQVHQSLLEAVYQSGSGLTLVPVQDLYGLRDRINVPGTVGAANWTWRLPWTLPQLMGDPQCRAQGGSLRRLAERSGRA